MTAAAASRYSTDGRDELLNETYRRTGTATGGRTLDCGDPAGDGVRPVRTLWLVTGWVKRWFVASWCLGMTFFAIGYYFQSRDGKPSGSVPWAALFTIAWANGVLAMFVAWRRDPELFRRRSRR